MRIIAKPLRINIRKGGGGIGASRKGLLLLLYISPHGLPLLGVPCWLCQKDSLSLEKYLYFSAEARKLLCIALSQPTSLIFSLYSCHFWPLGAWEQGIERT